MRRAVVRTLPSDFKCHADVVELISSCTVELLRSITTEASVVCEQTCEGVLAPHHIFTALGHLGYVVDSIEMRELFESIRSNVAGWNDKIGINSKRVKKWSEAEEEIIRLEQAALLEAAHHKAFG